MDFLSNFHMSDIYSAATRMVIGLIGGGVIWVIKLLFSIRKSVKKVEAENRELKERLEKITFENVLLADSKREYKRDLDQVLANNKELHRLLEEQGAKIEELMRENGELKRRIAELEAISPIETIRKRGTTELRLSSGESGGGDG